MQVPEQAPAETKTISARRTRLGTLAFAVSTLVPAANAAAAHPPFPVTFFWWGANGSGNGASDDFQNNWVRSYVDGEDLYYLPDERDVLDFSHAVALDATIHRSITLGSHSGVVGIGFFINADLTGGDLQVPIVRINNAPYAGFYPTTTFTGTKFQLDKMEVESFNKPITFSHSTISTPLLTLYGADYAGGNPAVGAGVTNFVSGSTVDASELRIGDSLRNEVSTHPYVVNVDASTLKGLGLGIRGNNGGVASHLELTNGSTAEYEQYVLVGADPVKTLSELVVKGGSTLRATQAYVNVGEQGPGAMGVADGSFAFMREFNIGVFAKGTANITNAATVTSDAGTLGVISGNEGTVNIETRGTWNTKALTVGQDGTGFVFVRDQSTLKVDGAAVLGHHPNSQGSLNLIGPDAKLQLGASGSLTIGDEGAGELHLEQGAQFTSAGDVSLGKVAKSSGTVIATGENSKWTVEGNLTIGEHGTGRVEIKDNATVKPGGAGIFLGKQSDGDGTLLIDGQGSKLDFDGQLIVADFGRGALRLKNGASLTTGSLSVGNFAKSEGTLDLQDAGSGQYGMKVKGDLTLGKAGRGIVTVAGGYTLTTEGDVVMGDSSTSGTEATPNQVTLSGAQSTWYIDGAASIGKAADSYSAIDVRDKASVEASGIQLTLGEGAGSHGVLNVTGAGEGDKGVTHVTIKDLLNVGLHGAGTLTVSKQALLKVHDVALGVEADGHGEIDISNADSTIDVAGDVDVGALGSGVLKVLDGGYLKVNGPFGLVVDSKQPEGASVTASGPRNGLPARIDARALAVGVHGWGAMTVDTNALVGAPQDSDTKMKVAQFEGSHGTVDLNNFGRLNLASFEAGVGGDAVITVTSDGELNAKTLTLGGGSGTSKLTVNGAKVQTSQFAAVTGSTITVSNVESGGGILLNSKGSFDLGGSAASPARLTVDSGGLVSVDSGATGALRAGSRGRTEVNVRGGGAIKVSDIEVGHPFDSSNGSSITVTGGTSELNSAMLTVHRGATLTTLQGGKAFAGDSATINGTVDVRGGLLLIGPDRSTTAQSGTVTVTPLGTISGDGFIKGNLTAKGAEDDGNPLHVTGAKIDPSKHPPSPPPAFETLGLRASERKVAALTDVDQGGAGLLTVEGNLSVEPRATLHMEIGGRTAGDTYDVVNVLGSAHVEGSVVLDFIDGFAPKAGDQFSLITGSNLVIAPQISFLNLADGWQYDVVQTGDAWTIRSLNDGISVPEPAGALLLFGAVTTLGLRRRRTTPFNTRKL